MNSGIYQIRNLANNKRYIGSTECIERRWRHHQRLLKINKHHSCHLQSAWEKYGKEDCRG